MCLDVWGECIRSRPSIDKKPSISLSESLPSVPPAQPLHYRATTSCLALSREYPLLSWVPFLEPSSPPSKMKNPNFYEFWDLWLEAASGGIRHRFSRSEPYFLKIGGKIWILPKFCKETHFHIWMFRTLN